jgi:hypothetical protein
LAGRQHAKTSERLNSSVSSEIILNWRRLCSPRLTIFRIREGKSVVGTDANRDFASLLDDLFVAPEKAEAAAPRPTIPFDYLSVAEELHSGRIRVSSEQAAAEYGDIGAGFEAELAALLKETEIVSEPDNAPGAEPLPSLEPEAIALELGLETSSAQDLGKLRRSFALNNHPDRVAPHLRQHALARMQVANRLIDEAKRRALPRRKS